MRGVVYEIYIDAPFCPAFNPLLNLVYATRKAMRNVLSSKTTDSMYHHQAKMINYSMTFNAKKHVRHLKSKRLQKRNMVVAY